MDWLADPSGWACTAFRARPVLPERGSYVIVRSSLQRLQIAAVLCGVAGGGGSSSSAGTPVITTDTPRAGGADAALPLVVDAGSAAAASASMVPSADVSARSRQQRAGPKVNASELDLSHVGWVLSQASVRDVLDHLRVRDSVKSPRMFQLIDCVVKLVCFLEATVAGLQRNASLHDWLRIRSSQASAACLVQKK
jgi:hypothetical protein